MSASDGAGSDHQEFVFIFHILLTQRTAQPGLGQRLSGVKEGYSESGIKSFTETFSYQDTEQRSGRDLGCSRAHSQLGCGDDGLGHCTEDTGDTGGQM